MTNQIIDWTKLWEIHAPHFKDGLSRIPLPNQKNLLLKPGPAFGDLSHPTTKLTLNLLIPLVKDQVVLDIGTGTGILGLASALLGAKAVYAYEIDPSSCVEAAKNIALNKLKKRVHLNVTPPEKFDLVLLNMISSEQSVALSQNPYLKITPHTIITSGILVSEKERYLENHPNWKILDEAEEDGWLAFRFSSSPQ